METPSRFKLISKLASTCAASFSLLAIRHFPILAHTRASFPTPPPPFASRSQTVPPAPSSPQPLPPTPPPSEPTHLPPPAVPQLRANPPALSRNTAPPSDPQSRCWVPHVSRLLREACPERSRWLGISASSPNKPSSR